MTDFQSEQLDYGGDRTLDLKHGSTLTIGRFSKPLWTTYDAGTNNRELKVEITHIIFSRCRRPEDFAPPLNHCATAPSSTITLFANS